MIAMKKRVIDEWLPSAVQPLVWMASFACVAVVVRGGADDTEWLILSVLLTTVLTPYMLWFDRFQFPETNKWVVLSIVALVGSLAICLVMNSANYTESVEELVFAGRTFSKGFYLVVAAIGLPVYPLMRAVMESSD